MHMVVVDGTFEVMVAGGYGEAIFMSRYVGVRIPPYLIVVSYPVARPFSEIRGVGCPYRPSMIVLSREVVE